MVLTTLLHKATGARFLHLRRFLHRFFSIFRKIKGLQLSKIVQNVRMNPYFDISSKTQICQKMSLMTLLHSADERSL